VSEGILHLCEEATGLFHLGGPARVSRYEFGEAVIDAFALDKKLVHLFAQKDIPMSAPRPADVSLNILKARSFGYSPLDYQEELRHIASGNYI
jgi:dTDP-4-dehydrorhamnose reductase